MKNVSDCIFFFKFSKLTDRIMNYTYQYMYFFSDTRYWFHN